MSALPPPTDGASTLILISDRTCLPSVSATTLVPAVLTVDLSTGRITSIASGAEVVAAARAAGASASIRVRDVGRLVLMAGLVDTHVHANEPGRTHWEGLETATRAAAAGGVTTIVDMPLNSIPPTTTLMGLQAKEEAAKGKLTVDLGLWGGIIPSNLADLPALAEGGVCGFKCFTIESGVEEFPCVSESELKSAMEMVVASCPTLPVLVHAEACAAHDHAVINARVAESDPRVYKNYLDSRPSTFESSAIAMAIKLAEETKVRMHVVHLSAQEGLPLFAEAHKRGSMNVTVETCPHYLTLDADSIPAGATSYKCAPPIREKVNQKALWAGLRAGTISMIVSDHSPCEPSLKKIDTGDFAQSWGGISSLQLGLPLIFSELRDQTLQGTTGAASSSAVTVDTFDPSLCIHAIHGWMSSGPSKFVNFSHRKGSLTIGYDADIVIWDPESVVLVAQEMIQHRHKLTPYLGKTLHGVVKLTILRGKEVYSNMENGNVKFSSPMGERVFPSSHKSEQARAAEQKSKQQ